MELKSHLIVWHYMEHITLITYNGTLVSPILAQPFDLEIPLQTNKYTILGRDVNGLSYFDDGMVLAPKRRHTGTPIEQHLLRTGRQQPVARLNFPSLSIVFLCSCYVVAPLVRSIMYRYLPTLIIFCNLLIIMNIWQRILKR